MTDTIYKISSWDAQVTCDGNTYQLSFMFVPDIQFVEYAMANNNVVQIQINDTNSIYDGNNFVVKVDSTAYGRNCSTNFNDSTKTWIATIPVDFTNFPPEKGTFKVVSGPFKAYDFANEKALTIEGYEPMVLGDVDVRSTFDPSLNQPAKVIEAYSNTGSNVMNMCMYVLVILLLFILATRYK